MRTSKKKDIYVKERVLFLSRKLPRKKEDGMLPIMPLSRLDKNLFCLQRIPKRKERTNSR
jgi:hypothetical protein